MVFKDNILVHIYVARTAVSIFSQGDGGMAVQTYDRKLGTKRTYFGELSEMTICIKV